MKYLYMFIVLLVTTSCASTGYVNSNNRSTYQFLTGGEIINYFKNNSTNTLSTTSDRSSTIYWDKTGKAYFSYKNGRKYSEAKWSVVNNQLCIATISSPLCYTMAIERNSNMESYLTGNYIKSGKIYTAMKFSLHKGDPLDIKSKYIVQVRRERANAQAAILVLGLVSMAVMSSSGSSYTTGSNDISKYRRTTYSTPSYTTRPTPQSGGLYGNCHGGKAYGC